MKGARRVRIKICGMTRREDALCATEAGVDALGFIFYSKSPRYIDPDDAQQIIEQLPPFVDTVGVFVDQRPETVQAIIRQCRLSHVQLHGSESPQYCRELSAHTGCGILKAVRVGPQTTADTVAAYNDCIQGFLLDTFHKDAVGGTGISFDWKMIAHLRLAKPFLLAGGLDVTNIAEALEQVLPYGVDANSGLETTPGVKDHTLIREFIARVRAVETQWSAGQQ